MIDETKKDELMEAIGKYGQAFIELKVRTKNSIEKGELTEIEIRDVFDVYRNTQNDLAYKEGEAITNFVNDEL